MLRFWSDWFVAGGLAFLVLVALVKAMQWGYRHGHLKPPAPIYYGASSDDDDDVGAPMFNPQTGLQVVDGFDSAGNPMGADYLGTSFMSSDSLSDD